MNSSMPFEEYAEIKDAINFSTLKYIDRSPLHYQHALRCRRDDTTRLLKGRAAHTAVLERDRFDTEYAVFPGKRRQGKGWNEFKEGRDESSILKQSEYDQALAIREAVMLHPVAGRLFSAGRPEQTVQWTDPRTGLNCKARIDWLSPIVLADLKTTGDVEARKFGALTARMRYHVQGAWYSDGVMHALGLRPPVKIVAVEAEPPHDVAVFTMSEDDLFAGSETYQGWLAKVAACRASGIWQGRYPEEELLLLPRYVFDDDDQEDGTGVVVQEDSVDELEG